jgi:hypothetical protein
MKYEAEFYKSYKQRTDEIYKRVKKISINLNKLSRFIKEEDYLIK